MKEVRSLKDIHQILLHIAIAFVEVCERHKIPYFMIGGTMLGSIRHKGFIPWDDDMDFGVYSDDYDKLKMYLKRDLKAPYRCISFENCEYVKYPFFKVEDSSTCVLDKTVDLPIEEMPGLNIDIFPIFPCKRKSLKNIRVFGMIKLVSFLYLESSENSKLKKSIRSLLRTIFYGLTKDKLLKRILGLAHSMTGDDKGNLFGRWKGKEIFPKNVYDALESYPFETTFFYGIKNFDFYLRQMYGDYMQLPQENMRKAHIQNVFLK